MTEHANFEPLRGFCAVTSAALSGDNSRLLAYCEAAMHSGVRLLRYRDERNPADIRLRLASVLMSLSRHFKTAFMIDHDIELAQRIGADGVHLDLGDRPIAEARSILGPQAIIGASCKSDVERARQAVAEGASYISFGNFFVHPDAADEPTVPLELLVEAKRELAVPVGAEGGVLPDNAEPLLNAGADLLTATRGVFDKLDVVAVADAADRYVTLFAPPDA